MIEPIIAGKIYQDMKDIFDEHAGIDFDNYSNTKYAELDDEYFDEMLLTFRKTIDAFHVGDQILTNQAKKELYEKFKRNLYKVHLMSCPDDENIGVSPDTHDKFHCLDKTATGK